MSAGRKIAASTVQNRTQTPFWNWLRNKLLAVDRQSVTPPPGVATPDGKAVYHNPLRFPNTQAARPGSAESPFLPGGVHHKLEANYYLSRDGRRVVLPPSPLYESDGHATKFGTPGGQEIKREDAVNVKVNHGPDTNFGLSAPTPGFGASWKRSTENELSAQKNDKHLEYLERFDKYRASN